MAARIRKNGRILCAAMHPPEQDDVYIDDGLMEDLIQKGVIVTEEMFEGGRGGHSEHGEWWFANAVPEDATADPFFERYRCEA